MTNYTAPVTLHLTTIHGIAAGLAKLGATWDPQPYDDDNPPSTNGLYGWATDDGAIIYLGIGERAKGDGLLRRVRYENDPNLATMVHGHGMAITRVSAAVGHKIRPYVGDVEMKQDFYPDWANSSRWSDRYIHHLSKVVEGLKEKPYKQAEKFAIRLSMHLGDVGAPANSQFKGAWAFAKASIVGHSDAAAQMVAEQLRGPYPPAAQ